MTNAVNNIIRYFLDNYLLVLGFCGQGLFFGRFLVQWIASERQRRSVVPIAFWYFSIGGGGLLLIYALLKKDPVFILGQGGGLIIYFRNLYLIHREHSRGRV
ncbi:MAG: lipid-A-disaccharide synthase N-terminal domain-containing protein [Syntrophobacteraceae bacterium]